MVGISAELSDTDWSDAELFEGGLSLVRVRRRVQSPRGRDRFFRLCVGLADVEI